MNAIITELVINIFMAGLLSVTIFYCFKLNKRIRVLQDSKNEFATLIERFDVTTQKAQASIEELQTVATRVNDELSGRLDKANFLADDLAFMIEKGSKLADRMEGDVRGGAAKQSQAASSRSAAQPSAATRGRSTGKEALGDGKKASLDALMQKATAKRNAEASVKRANNRRSGVSARLRSKAEQELYDALKGDDN